MEASRLFVHNNVRDAYKFDVRDGLMSIDFGPDREDVGSVLKRAITRWVGDVEASSMDKIFRCSRMCFELYESGIVSNLTREDVEILYSLRLDETTSKLFRTMNLAGGLKAVTVHGMSPSECHAAAMSILATMSG